MSDVRQPETVQLGDTVKVTGTVTYVSERGVMISLGDEPFDQSVWLPAGAVERVEAVRELVEAAEEVARSRGTNCAMGHSNSGACDCAGDKLRAALAKVKP